MGLDADPDAGTIVGAKLSILTLHLANRQNALDSRTTAAITAILKFGQAKFERATHAWHVMVLLTRVGPPGHCLL